MSDYQQKKENAIMAFSQILTTRTPNTAIAIGGKKTSNLFRDRSQGTVQKLNIADFNTVFSIDPINRVAEVGGMTTYEDFVKQTLSHGLMPTVVPELKSITVGGAVTGVGIEATSFRYGFVHETIREMDILCGDGVVRTCSPTNEHSDLFYGFPNSYGTLGYALKLTVPLIPVKKYVRVRHKKFHDSQTFFAAIQDVCNQARKADGIADFIDGVAFDRGVYYLSVASFVDHAPTVSDYTFMNIYYHSILKKIEDYLTAHDYIWRWDTDWFWCSRFFGVEHPIVRRILGRKRLRSTTYWKIRKFATQYGLTALISRINGTRESVIQDVEIPIEHAEEFINFFHNEIGIKPFWMCPTIPAKEKSFTLYTTKPGQLYINFGFWDSVASDKEEGYYNRLIENKVQELHGKKSLYSSSYYPESQFWQLYNKQDYEALKSKYDPQSMFKNLYQKCVKKG
ncbi:MAG: FAD-binding oxidoreductase [Patescibacteria group bacterium]